ncbi:putative Ig domain-containing protein [Thermodesulfobacteriota bacterium]
MGITSKRIFGLLFVLFIFSSIFSPTFASEVTIFGPNQYVRTTGLPDIYTDSFTTSLPDIGKIIVRNGNQIGEHRIEDTISSAKIYVNGELIFGPNDFKVNVYYLEAPIALVENNSITIELRSNPDSYVNIQITQDIDPPTVNISADPDAIKVNENSTLTWSSNNADSCVIEPDIGNVDVIGSIMVSPDETTPYIMTATGPGGIATDSVTITHINTPPIADDQAVDLNEDEAKPIALTASDIDEDSLTYQVVSYPGYGTLSGDAPNVIYTPNANYNGNDTFTFKVNDGLEDSNTAIVTLTINPVNDVPTISGTPAISVDEDTFYIFTPVADDIDIGDSLIFSIINQPSWADFDTSTGELIGTPANDDVGTTTGIVITVTDTSGADADLPAFDLTVVNVNDPPTISGTPSTTVNEDTNYIFTPSADDIDLGDILTFSIVNQPSWASFDTNTGTLSGVPENEDVGTSTAIVITVADTSFANASLPAFDLTVLNVNDAPVISGSPPTTVDEDTFYSFIPAADDIDVGDTLTFSIVNKPQWASFNTTTGELTGTPRNDDVGTTISIVITVTDTSGASADLPAFDLTVVNVNDTPTISGNPSTSVDVGDSYSFVPVADDPDVGDTLNFSIENKPEWADFNTSTGELSGTPGPEDAGTFTGIVIAVTDSGMASASLPAFDITVEATYPVPTVTISANPEIIVIGRPSALTWNSTDADSCLIEPGVGNVDLSGTTDVSPTEITTYTITATGPGGLASDSATITVLPPPADVDLGLCMDEHQGGGGLVGETIRILNGNTIESRSDLRFPSPNRLGLTLQAFYNSRSDIAGSMGHGWTHTYELSLDSTYDISGVTFLKITDSTGCARYFTEETSGEYSGVFAERTHVKLESGEYIWYRLDGSQYGFSSTGQLIRMDDASGNQLVLAYSGNRLQAVTDNASGRVLSFYYNGNNLLDHVTGPVTAAVADGIWITYGYDTNNKLTSVTYADG